MLRALYKSSSHKSRLLQSLLLLPSSSSFIFNALSTSRRHLNLIRPDWTYSTTRFHSTNCRRLQLQQRLVTTSTTKVPVDVSITTNILPCATNAHLRPPMHPFLNGEGSWNVSWDARPARWLHRPDSAWFLFGICSCLPPVLSSDCNSIVTVDFNGSASSDDDNAVGRQDTSSNDDYVVGRRDTSSNDDNSTVGYKVTGVLADGRCLFRAIAHGACLRAGKEAPDQTQETRMADELRALVADELLKRREEYEGFIEGDFDAYVKSIELPHVWGGEPELLMVSHVLQTPIHVFTMDSKSQKLIIIAKYGEQYQDNGDAINVLSHGYGHYDLVETN